MPLTSAPPTSELRSSFRERTSGRCWITITTPFARDGSVDEHALRRNLQRYISDRLSDFQIGFVACGTFGECLAMSDDERRAVIKATVEEAGDRIPVAAVVFSGDSRLDRALGMIRFSEAVGADAVCLAPPAYYFRPTINGVQGWLSALAGETRLGLILYNLAGRFAYYLECREVVRLIESIPSLVGMKLSSPSLEEQIRMINAVGQSIAVVEGAELLAPQTLPLGAVAYMSSTATFAPALMAAWSRAISGGDTETLAALQNRLQAYRRFQATVRAEPPSVLKAAMDLVGLAGGAVRLPLTPLDGEEMAELEEALQELQLVTRGRAVEVS